MAGLVLLAGTAAATADQPPAAPPAVQLATPAVAGQPAAPVMPAEQVAPTELTELLGQAVVDAKGAELGRIVDLLVDGQGQVRAAVIDVGGFMGVGSRKVAVAWAALRFAAKKKGPEVSITIPSDRIKSWADYIAGRPVAILGVPNADK